MLGTPSYSKKYINECRANINLQLSTYKKLISTARDLAGKNENKLNKTIEAFEHPFFNNLVLVLDEMFVHRLRGKELKDGNPLNEVRVLCNSIMLNEGLLVKDTQIKQDPAKSVLKLKMGDKIVLKEKNFEQLAKAFFDEITAKFGK